MNNDKCVNILWQGDFTTKSRFIYYGQGTRNEYRITRFGRRFEFLREEYSGSLLLISKLSDEEYLGFVLSSDEDIEGFFEHFSISASNRQMLIDNTKKEDPIDRESQFIQFFLDKYQDFPETKEMAFWGQKYSLYCENQGRKAVLHDPDKLILKWLETEYRLFQTLEEKIYHPIYTTPFESSGDIITFANTILNRRKSRAGKSLEHHLSRIFRVFRLKFAPQAQTEGNKKPDFIFPSAQAYHSVNFSSDRLVFLGAKTTCKDRWRQILNEADRIPHKYLFTLQKGISIAQMKEMRTERVSLVVPSSHISSFAPECREHLLSLRNFIDRVQITQS